MDETIRVVVDRKNGHAVSVAIPSDYAEPYQERIIEYAKALALYYKAV